MRKTSPVPNVSLNFYDALKKVMEGEKITRKEWKNKSIYGKLDGGAFMIHKKDNKLYHWILTDGDILAKDWIIL